MVEKAVPVGSRRAGVVSGWSDERVGDVTSSATSESAADKVVPAAARSGRHEAPTERRRAEAPSTGFACLADAREYSG